MLKKFLWRFSGKSRPFRLTRAGWIFILYTIGIGAGSINTGNNLLYLIFGIFLGLILASGVLSDFTLWKIETDFSFPKDAMACEPNLLGIRIVNHKRWLPSLSLFIEAEGEVRGKSLSFRKYVPVISPKESLTTCLLLMPPLHGWFQLKSLKVATRFPFGLIYKWWRIDDPQTINTTNQQISLDPTRGFLIYPKVRHLSFFEVYMQQRGQEEGSIDNEKGDGVNVYEIRPFRDGDNYKRIHWKTSAKRQGLEPTDPFPWLVRDMEAEEKDEITIKWPALELLIQVPPDLVFEFVEFTASLIFYLNGKNKKFELYIPSSQSDTSLSWRVIRPLRKESLYQAIMEFLALFDERAPKQGLSLRYLKPVAAMPYNVSGALQGIDLWNEFQKYKKVTLYAA